LPAIRKSVKGTAADVLLNLGERVSPDEIVNKFEVIFGNVLSVEALLEEFYTARQSDTEMVAEWSCGLESLLAKARQRGASLSNIDGMLRSKFWASLRDDRVKNGTRHRFDRGDSFEMLLEYARQIEHEVKVTPTRNVRSVGQGVDSMEQKMDELMKMVQGLNKRIENLENKPHTSKDTRTCYFCGETGHIRRRCPKTEQGNGY